MDKRALLAELLRERQPAPSPAAQVGSFPLSYGQRAL